MPGLVFHKDKIVYWFVPKNACTTLKKFFADNAGLQYRDVHNAPFERTNVIISEYYNFAIVRHPVDRLWSLYKDKLKPDGRNDRYHTNGVQNIVLAKYRIFHKDMTFDEFVDAIISIQNPDDHFGLQTGQIPKGVDIHKFEETLLLKVLPKKNVSQPRGYISPETIQKNKDTLSRGLHSIQLHMKALIVALKYLEPEYKETLNCLEAYHSNYIFCDRKGVGNMAKAYNDGFKAAMADPQLSKAEYIWFISNITFKPGTLKVLVDAMDHTGYAAMCPVYKSDHLHLQPRSFHYGKEVEEIPFVEFTCPIVRTSVFKQFQLDEYLPYYYHDLDWSYRVRQAGHKLGVHLGVEIGHVYLRDKEDAHPISVQRARLRNRATPRSQSHMVAKYGRNWRKIVWPKSVSTSTESSPTGS